MSIIFGPAGLGSVKKATETLQDYHKKGIRACEIAFTYGVYIKNKEEALLIGKKALDLGISLSIHAPFYVNLNSEDKTKVEATKKRILDCCEIGELMGVKNVVFHPGYYGKDREKSYTTIKEGIIDLMKNIKKNNWKIKLAPETMGKINVFGSIEEVSNLVKETGCSFCIDFAHILARDKKVDYSKVENLFSSKDWHVHFSGIVYGEKGERHHIKTGKNEWKELLKNLPKEKNIIIINESPEMIEDCLEGMEIYKKL